MELAAQQQARALAAVTGGRLFIGLAHEGGEVQDSAYSRQPVTFEVHLAEGNAVAVNAKLIRFAAFERDSAADVRYFVLADSATGDVFLRERLTRPVRPAADEELFFRAGELAITIGG